MSDRQAEGTQRAVDKSNPDHTGSPRKMASTCLNCGYRKTAGCAVVWLDVEDGKSKPRDDVSFLCRECDEVTDHKIEILKRWPGTDE